MSTQDSVTKLRKAGSGLIAALVVLSVVVILVAVNVIGGNAYARLDLTEYDINTLSETSEEAVETMEGLEIRFYRSKTLPKSLQAPGTIVENVPRLLQLVEDKLDEYQRASDGNLTIKVVEEDLEKQADALNLLALRIPQEKSENVDPELLNRRFFLGLSLHYRTVEEVIPAIVSAETFEYDVTKALLRLKSKQSASAVQQDLLEDGKALNEAVESCVQTINRYDVGSADEEQGEEALEGGVMDQIKTAEGDRAKQIEAYLNNLETIDATCQRVGTLLAKERQELDEQSEGKGREVSLEHYRRLLNQIGWFDGLYGAWVATLVGEAREPHRLTRLIGLLDHPEVPARTTALRKLADWLRPSELQGGPPPLQGPPAQQAASALRRGAKDEDPVVRAVAIQLLAQNAGAAADEELVAGLKDPDPTVREVAFDMAMRLGVKLPMESVRPFLKASDWQTRRIAAAYIAETATDVSKVADQLRPLLDDPNREVQFMAAYALAKGNDTASRDEIQAVLDGLPAGRAREALQDALSAMSGDGAPKAPPTEEAPTEEPPAEEPPAQAPPGGSATPRTPGAPPQQAAPQGGFRQALGRAGLDRLGDVQMPGPVEGVGVLEGLQSDISQAYDALKDAPGKKSIGFLCGHQEFCPFADTESKIPDELVQAFEQQPFIKKAVDDVKSLEQRLNQHNEAIRQYFLSRGYNLVRVDAGEEVPEDIASLVIYGPQKPFTELDLYYVDQFILSGKPVILMLNQFDVQVAQWAEKDDRLATEIESTETNLNPLLSHYGVKANHNLVMEKNKALYERINVVDELPTNIGYLPTNAKFGYPLFPTFETFSETDPMVSGLRRVTLPFVSTVEPVQGQPGLTFEALIRSSEDAVVKSEDFVLDPRALKDAVNGMPSDGPVTVAARVHGDGATSYFAGRDRPEKPAAPKQAEDAPPKDEEKDRPQLDKGQVNLVVIGSTLGFECLNPSCILEDFNLGQIAQEKVTGLGAAIPYYIRYMNAWGRFIGQQTPVHKRLPVRVSALPGQQVEFWEKSLDFLFGVFDWATGDAGLAEIRAKANTERPLKVEDEASVQRVTYGLVIGLPILVVLFAFLRLWLRRVGRRRLSFN